MTFPGKVSSPLKDGLLGQEKWPVATTTKSNIFVVSTPFDLLTTVKLLSFSLKVTFSTVVEYWNLSPILYLSI